MIRGVEVARLRSSSTRGKPRNETPMLVSVPRSILDKCSSIRSLIDSLRASRMPFPHTTSESVKLRTSPHLRILTKESLRDATNKVAKLHSSGGFKAKHANTNLKLDYVKESSIEIGMGMYGID